MTEVVLAREPRYRLLGPVEVVRDHRPAELGGPKQRAVLALLLLEAGRVVSIDRLLDAVWGDDHPASAAAGLQAYISNLRRALRDDEHAPSPIVRKGPGYLIDASPEDVDLTRFAGECAAAQAAIDANDWTTAAVATRRAGDLWRGPLLVEYADEDWVRVAAAPLDEQRAVCAQNQVVALLGLDRVGEALARSRQLVDDQPLSERACWLHAVSLYRAGRSAESLDALQAYSRRMNDELGLDVGPALRDVQGAVLRQDPALSSWPVVAASGTTTPPVVEPERSAADVDPAREVASDLVGRQRELEVAHAVLDRARHEAGWVVLTGPAGIGKTRLAEELTTSRQAAGGRTVRAGCPDDAGVPAWWPVRQVLRSLGDDPDDLLTPPDGVDADAARFAAYDAVAHALERALRAGPLLLLIEDVHWADTASLRLLTHLAGTGASLAGLAVMITARDDEGGPDLDRLLAAVARRSGSRRLSLPPLTTDEVGTLAQQVSGRDVDPREAAALAERTGGNAFFVSEYARLSEGERGELPAAVRSVLGRRLAALDPAVVQVLRTAALIGDTVEIDLLAAVTRLDRDELADLLDDAADEHVVVTAPGRDAYVFAHALLRDEVLAGLSPVRRQRLHLRVAEALDAGDTDRLVRRAAHLVAAQPLADAAVVFAACRAAALDAERTWDPETAAQWWAHALTAFDQLTDTGGHDRDDLVVAQVATLARAGRGQTVLDVIEAALFDAVRRGRLDSAGRLASTLIRTSGSWPWAAYGSDPAPLLTRLAGVESLMDDNPAAHVSVLAALAVGSYYDPDPHVPDRLSNRAVELAESIDDRDALADALLGRALAFSGVVEHAAESIRVLERLATIEHRTQEFDEVIAHGLLFLAQLSLGDARAAAEHARFGALGSDLLRLATSRVQFRWAEGTLVLLRGDDIARAEALYDRALELHRQTELYESGVFDVARIAVQWERGTLDQGDFADANPRVVPWAAAICAVAEGDPRAAELLAAEIHRVEQPTWTTHGRLTMLAHAVADAGLPELAAPLIERLSPLSRCLANIGQCGVVGPVALATARLHLLVGDATSARSSLVRAEEVAARAQAHGALLRCRLVRARLGDADGPEIASVAAEAERRGMHGVAREARTLRAGRRGAS